MVAIGFSITVVAMFQFDSTAHHAPGSSPLGASSASTDAAYSCRRRRSNVPISASGAVGTGFNV